MRRLLVTEQARLDIRDVLAWTAYSFGMAAARRYEALIDQSFIDLCLDPVRPGVHAVPEVRLHVCLYRIEYSRHHVLSQMGRVKRARHVIIFHTEVDGTIVINRFMHESMKIEFPLEESEQ